MARGYSMLELAVSLGVFLLLASVVSLAVTQSMVSQAATRTERVVSKALESNLTSLSKSNYDQLLSNTFKPPTPCAGDESKVGTNAKSCINIANQNYRVGYDVVVGADNVSSGGDGAYVNITASVILADKSVVEAARRVEAPIVGYAPGAGVVRVTLSGDYSALTGPLHLLSGGAAPTSLATGQREGNVVLLRTDAEDCTTAQPCSIGLAAGAKSAEAGPLGMQSLDSTSDSIVLTDGGLVESAAKIFTRGTASIDLVARSDTAGISGNNNVAGSVCLWGTFNDGASRRSVPLCNTGDSPGTIQLDSYSPRPDQPARRVPFPVGTPIKISVDNPNGTCPMVSGMVGHTTSGWVTAAVCSSWTWGVPATFGPVTGDQGPLKDAQVTLTAGQATKYQAVWSGDQARAAAGYSNQNVWAKPRQAAGCAFDATCVPHTGPAPEVSECPGQHCLSVANAAPVLTAPVSGSQRVNSIKVTSSTTSFTLGASDADGNPLSITLQSTTARGTLHKSSDGSGTALANGSVIQTSTATPASVTLSYKNPPGNTSLDTFKVLLSDGKPNGDKLVEVAIYHNTQAWELRPATSTIAQGQSGALSVTLVGTNGEVLPSTSVLFSGPPTGSTLSSSSAITSADGVATVNLNVSTTPGGTHSVTATSGGRTTSVPVKVTASAGSLTLQADGNAQGKNGVMVATARDRSGAALPGVSVTLAITQEGVASELVYPEYAGCVTQANGTCSSVVVVESGAKAGNYLGRAQSGNVTAQDSLSVTQLVNSIASSSLNVPQGTSATTTITVKDGAGDPISGVTPTLVAPSGMTATLSGVTNSSGQSTMTVTAAATRGAGELSVTAMLSSRSYQLGTVVTPVAKTLEAGPSVVVDQGGATSTWVVVKDKAGNLMPGAQVTFSVPTASGLQVASKATSAQDGRAATGVNAKTTATVGDGFITAAAPGVTSITVPYTVRSTPASVSVQGSALSNGNSSFQLTARYANGTPVVGATIKATSPVSGLTLTNSSAQTNSSGVMMINAKGNGVPPGTYSLTVKVNNTSLTTTLTVS